MIDFLRSVVGFAQPVDMTPIQNSSRMRSWLLESRGGLRTSNANDHQTGRTTTPLRALGSPVSTILFTAVLCDFVIIGRIFLFVHGRFHTDLQTEAHFENLINSRNTNK